MIVDLYIDFLCPFCRRFEQASGAALRAIVAAGRGKLVYHPLSFLDRLSACAMTRAASFASNPSGFSTNKWQPESRACMASEKCDSLAIIHHIHSSPCQTRRSAA